MIVKPSFLFTSAKFFAIGCWLPCLLLGNDVKMKIRECECALEQTQKAEANEKRLALAKLYYADQNHEKAFSYYLKSLEGPPLKSSEPISSVEKPLYDQALKIYLDHHVLSAAEGACKIAKDYGPILAEHPEYHRLGFLVAVSYANLSKFDHFFDLFYKSYQSDPDHFLAHKTKAILHIKLFERCLPGPEKTGHHRAIIYYLQRAAEVYPRDASLYRTMVVFAPDEIKYQILAANLNKILDDNIMTPRPDIEFYVREALAQNDVALAQRFLDKAKEWYQYSRVINYCQELIELKKDPRKKEP